MLVSIKIVNEIFYKVFLMLSLYNTACNVRVHHDSDTQFLLEILDLYLDFTKVTAKKVDSHAQIVPNIFKIFQVLNQISTFTFIS